MSPKYYKKLLFKFSFYLFFLMIITTGVNTNCLAQNKIFYHQKIPIVATLDHLVITHVPSKDILNIIEKIKRFKYNWILGYDHTSLLNAIIVYIKQPHQNEQKILEIQRSLYDVLPIRYAITRSFRTISFPQRSYYFNGVVLVDLKNIDLGVLKKLSKAFDFSFYKISPRHWSIRLNKPTYDETLFNLIQVLNINGIDASRSRYLNIISKSNITYIDKKEGDHREHKRITQQKNRVKKYLLVKKTMPNDFFSNKLNAFLKFGHYLKSELHDDDSGYNYGRKNTHRYLISYAKSDEAKVHNIARLLKNWVKEFRPIIPSDKLMIIKREPISLDLEVRAMLISFWGGSNRQEIQNVIVKLQRQLCRTQYIKKNSLLTICKTTLSYNQVIDIAKNINIASIKILD